MFFHSKHSSLLSLRVIIIGQVPLDSRFARVLQTRGAENVTVIERDVDRYHRPQGGSLDLHNESGQAALRAAGLHAEFMKLARPEGEGFSHNSIGPPAPLSAPLTGPPPTAPLTLPVFPALPMSVQSSTRSSSSTKSRSKGKVSVHVGPARASSSRGPLEEVNRLGSIHAPDARERLALRLTRLQFSREFGVEYLKDFIYMLGYWDLSDLSHHSVADMVRLANSGQISAVRDWFYSLPERVQALSD
ncbi:hypothetical protein M427DRAFT_26787 [Gonapodya prolifera JEL478]|uniref:FAD-binding domain-containing protein n=1 Tax=Gonapodya prolifera (strain JEL478) TaxID=1344416 RepID=A0A139AZH8_GONPJ|nr:hypothetical protein M427DRAFT_26787 [Gonapodya prolifera JEL478]|eukprot:KXS22148.1 hypothetical protein M427DRAFT_26787 [Gonapodya prolifera JEL478]